jgi:hypothetical protein
VSWVDVDDDVSAAGTGRPADGTDRSAGATVAAVALAATTPSGSATPDSSTERREIEMDCRFRGEVANRFMHTRKLSAPNTQNAVYRRLGPGENPTPALRRRSSSVDRWVCPMIVGHTWMTDPRA